jgi:hypothetical protein
MSRSLLVLVCAAALVSLSMSNPMAAEKPAAKKPAPAAAKRPPLAVGEAAIERALASPTCIEFIDAPLSDVIDSLKDLHRIEIQFDKKALDDVGITDDTPVTKNLRGVSLRSALNLMLRDLNLTWTIKDEVLLITTPEEAEPWLITKVYDVADLVVCRKDDDELWDDYDTLIEVVTTTVRPTTWDYAGGPGSISGAGLGTAKVMIVNQARDVHEEIARLLADIRKIAQKTPDEEPPRRNTSIAPPQTDLGGLGASEGKSDAGVNGKPPQQGQPQQQPNHGGGLGMF